MSRKRKPKARVFVPTEAPLHPLFLPRDDTADDVLTQLILAAEELAAPRDGMDRSLQVEHAIPADLPIAAPDHFDWLADLAGHISAAIEANARASRMIDPLPDAFASAWGIQTLFRSLFPQAQRPVREPARSFLTKRELEILRKVSQDSSHEDISRDLNIAPRTVARHMQNIYEKLGVNRPTMAVARAVEIGLLNIEPSHIVRFVAKSVDRSTQMVDTFCQGAGSLDSNPALADLKRLAGFGLLLLAVSGAMARQLSGDRPESFSVRGLVLELDRHGAVQRAFGPDKLGTAHNIIQAPQHAAAAGFTPRNLLIAHDLVPQQGLNRGAISEYTPEGEYLRTFCGGKHLATRIIGPLSLAFAADGRLLATSGWLTDGILAFSEGGRSVSRFADGLFMQITINSKGRVYGAQLTDLAGAVRAFEPDGRDTGILTDEATHNLFQSITLSPDGHFFVCQLRSFSNVNQSFILQFDKDGRRLREFAVPGYRWSLLACDAEGRLYVPCDADGTVKVVREDGAVLQTFPLGGRVMPRHTAISADGRLWVCGRAL